MAETVSMAQFSRMAEISKPATTKAVRRGDLNLTANRMIDLNDPKNAAALAMYRRRAEVERQLNSRRAPVPAPVDDDWPDSVHGAQIGFTDRDDKWCPVVTYLFSSDGDYPDVTTFHALGALSFDDDRMIFTPDGEDPVPVSLREQPDGAFSGGVA